MHAEQLEGGRALTGAELSSPRAIWAWEGGGDIFGGYSTSVPPPNTEHIKKPERP